MCTFEICTTEERTRYEKSVSVPFPACDLFTLSSPTLTLLGFDIDFGAYRFWRLFHSMIEYIIC